MTKIVLIKTENNSCPNMNHNLAKKDRKKKKKEKKEHGLVPHIGMLMY